MKRFLVLPLLSCGLITACGPTRDQNRHRHPAEYTGRFGYQGEATEQIAPDNVPAPADTTDATAVSQPTPPPPVVHSTPPPPPVSHESTYGIPVPGKRGFVTSPYAPNSGLVDVRGYPPGTPVKDPYTGRVFLVP